MLKLPFKLSDQLIADRTDTNINQWNVNNLYTWQQVQGQFVFCYVAQGTWNMGILLK